MAAHKNMTFSLSKFMRFTLFMLCFTSAILQAGDKEKQLVLEVYPQWFSNDNYTVQGNIGIDKEFQDNNWIEYYVKPSAAYALDNNWALHGGLGLYYKDYRTSDNRLEVRPYAGVSHYIQIAEKWTLGSYLRVEERYYAYTGDQNSTNAARLRLRVRASHTLDSHSLLASWDKFTVGGEVFKSQNSDQNTTYIDDTYDYETRLVLGLERNLRNHSKLRFELAWKYQSLPSEVSTSSVNTVYFKIKYYPVWGNKLRNILSDRGIDE